MFNIFNISHTELDSKTNELSRKIESAQSVFSITSKHDWDNIFELCKTINEHFKKVRYPTIAERNIAWQFFFNLRDTAYKVRNNQTYNHSKNFFDDIMSQLNSVDYNALSDLLIGQIMFLGLLKTTADDMKAKGRELNKIGAYFKSVKHEMILEHKTKIHERMIEIRKNHDAFWGQHNSYQAEVSKVYEAKKQAGIEKSRQVKAGIESNLESNIDKRYKAKEALERIKRKRDDLQEKIYDSHSDNWKSKAEGWLDEFNDKIRDIEEQIERIEKWIEEDREKLRNWT